MEYAINNYRELATYVNGLVRDEKTIRLLTGMPEADARDMRSIAQMYRLMHVAFAVAYCKWLKVGQSSSKQGEYKYARNIVSIFELLYKAEQCNLDVIIYALTEIKRDILYNPESIFRGILSKEYREYSRYYGIIYEWKNRLSGSEQNREIIFTLMKNLVTDLEFLNDFKIVKEGKKSCFNTGGETFDFYDILYEDSVECWHMLKERSVYGESKYLTYINLDDFSESDIITKYYREN